MLCLLLPVFLFYKLHGSVSECHTVVASHLAKQTKDEKEERFDQKEVSIWVHMVCEISVCSTICSNHGLLKILAEDSKLKPKISFLNKIKAVFILSVWYKRQENVSSVLHRAGTTDAPKRKGVYIRRETKVCH